LHFSEQAVAAISVLALLGGLVLLLRKRQGGGLWPRLLNRKTRGLLAVEDRLSLGPQYSLYVVRVESRKLLVGTGPGGVSFGPELEEFRTLLGRASAAGEERTV
jgi:flagellar biogenesis protein FliO